MRSLQRGRSSCNADPRWPWCAGASKRLTLGDGSASPTTSSGKRTYKPVVWQHGPDGQLVPVQVLQLYCVRSPALLWHFTCWHRIAPQYLWQAVILLTLQMPYQQASEQMVQLVSAGEEGEQSNAAPLVVALTPASTPPAAGGAAAPATMFGQLGMDPEGNLTTASTSQALPVGLFLACARCDNCWQAKQSHRCNPMRVGYYTRLTRTF